jgi:hypothetical protein
MSIDEQPRDVADAGRTTVPPTRVFINYRTSDTLAEARLLYRDLRARYGAENVFFDKEDLAKKTGQQWLDEIKASANSSGVFLALIGLQWSSIIAERETAAQDIVKVEIETALRSPDITVVPVFIDGAVPDTTKLPPSLSRLAAIQGVAVRQDSWDDDVERLMGKIDEIAAAPKLKPPPPPPPPPPEQPDPGARRVAPLPDTTHFDEVLEALFDGTMVPILGSGVNASDRESDWSEGCGSLPDADELANALATRWNLPSADLDLSRVAQYVMVQKSWPDLSNALEQILGTDCSPSSVHNFFATLPAALGQLGVPDEKRHQLIVTTNYDDALERAFARANQEYDLVVYMANGEQEQKGKFFHVPYDGAPKTILSPNDYSDLPIRYGHLKRSVIVKIHGAVETTTLPSPWEKNYVVTEDHYIDYLSGGPIVQLVPAPILKKLKESHCLFLGYTMSDWNLRVFLKRIWEEGELRESGSWALERDPEAFEKRFWTRGLGVELFDAPLATYVSGLAAHLQARGQA